MTAEEHNKTLATLHFIYGGMHGLTLIGFLLLALVAGLTTPLAELVTGYWILIVVVVFLILFVAVGLLPVVVGYGLRKQRRWAKRSGMLLGVISLINIPIGTALGIYSIKFLRSEDGKSLYGGDSTTVTDGELQTAMRGAQPLMNLAARLKPDSGEKV